MEQIKQLVQQEVAKATNKEEALELIKSRGWALNYAAVGEFEMNYFEELEKQLTSKFGLSEAECADSYNKGQEKAQKQLDESNDVKSNSFEAYYENFPYLFKSLEEQEKYEELAHLKKSIQEGKLWINPNIGKDGKYNG